jgi:hypothetical protein
MDHLGKCKVYHSFTDWARKDEQKCGLKANNFTHPTFEMHEERFLSIASRCAQESTMHGKPVSFGHNHIRTYSKDGMICNCCSCHAEIHALRNACKLKVVHREKTC